MEITCNIMLECSIVCNVEHYRGMSEYYENVELYVTCNIMQECSIVCDVEHY